MSGQVLAFEALSTGCEPHVGTVLVVEDDDVHGEEIAEALSAAGVSSIVVSGFEDAVELLQLSNEFTAVVTDFYLQGFGNGRGNGLDLIDSIGRKFPGRDLKCIIMSGDPDVAADCALFGPVSFVPKPVQAERLIASLANGSEKTPENETIARLERTVRHQNTVIARLSERLLELSVTA